MVTSSNVKPTERQLLQGYLFVNFDVVESTNEEGVVSYSYVSLKLPENSTEMQINDAITDYKAKLKVYSISPRQARLQLLSLGLLDDLEAVITTNRAWQIEWEYATEVKRNSPLIDAVATQAGLTEEQIDQMFIDASKL